MSLRRFNVFSRASSSSSEYQPSRESTSSSVINRPLSYASHASSDDGVAPNGSNATNPIPDIYEDMEGITLEMRNTNQTKPLKDMNHERDGKGPRYRRNTNLTKSSRDVNHERNGKGPRSLYYRTFRYSIWRRHGNTFKDTSFRCHGQYNSDERRRSNTAPEGLNSSILD